MQANWKIEKMRIHKLNKILDLLSFYPYFCNFVSIFNKLIFFFIFTDNIRIKKPYLSKFLFYSVEKTRSIIERKELFFYLFRKNFIGKSLISVKRKPRIERISWLNHNWPLFISEKFKTTQSFKKAWIINVHCGEKNLHKFSSIELGLTVSLPKPLKTRSS